MNFDGDGHWRPFEDDRRPQRVSVSHRAATVVGTANHRGNRQHAFVCDARQFVLEVAGDHVSDLADGIKHLLIAWLDFRSQHAGRHRRR